MKKLFQNTNTSKHAFFALILALLILPVSSVVMADSENDMLKERIEKLEKEIIELKTLANQKAASEEKTVKPPASDIKSFGGFGIKPYGYIKLDAAYNDSAVVNGNYVLYVPSEGAVKNDDEFNITARQTRLGLVVTAPEYDGWKTTGKVEIDFYGDGSVSHETKAEPMLRHAFVEIGKDGLSFLAGQTWDVIGPLNPSTLNYSVGWGAGNNGYIRPQVRMSYNRNIDKGTSLLTQIALSRTTGLANENLDGGAMNDGDDSGFPTLQVRAALSTKLFTDQNAVIGVSGHYGKEEVDWFTGPADLKSWSLNMDFMIPLPDRLTFSGEIFMGENLDDYFGGAVQGVNRATRNEIAARGIWMQLNYIHNAKLQYNAGFGVDDPDYDDINIGNRDLNSFYFINTMYNLFPPLTVGIEYTYWETEYRSAAKGTANRLQVSAIYSW